MNKPVSLTIILDQATSDNLTLLAGQRTVEGKRVVSRSEITRDALREYLDRHPVFPRRDESK